jgi:hypothetical protein
MSYKSWEGLNTSITQHPILTSEDLILTLENSIYKVVLALVGDERGCFSAILDFSVRKNVE